MSDRRRSERAGRRAETLAAFLLRCKGYQIIARRYATPVGEVDLVARRGSLLAFVEVKRRSTADAALAALGAAQRRRITRAAEAFLAEHPELSRLECRFDVIAVAGSWPQHVTDAWR